MGEKIIIHCICVTRMKRLGMIFPSQPYAVLRHKGTRTTRLQDIEWGAYIETDGRTKRYNEQSKKEKIKNKSRPLCVVRHNGKKLLFVNLAILIEIELVYHCL
jgi:hypothetical protein